jgi:hypothetical protein
MFESLFGHRNVFRIIWFVLFTVLLVNMLTSTASAGAESPSATDQQPSLFSTDSSSQRRLWTMNSLLLLPNNASLTTSYSESRYRGMKKIYS